MPNLIPICEPDTEEWSALRLKGVGASEAGAVCGLSEWSTPLEVFLRKTGQIAADPDNDATIMGHLLEPVIWKRFHQLTKIPVVRSPVGMLVHPEHEFIFATPDALVETEAEGLQVAEAKTMNWRMAKRLGEEPEDIPVEWMLQMQQQLLVTGLEVGRLAVLLDGRTLLNFRVERNQNLIDAIVEAEKEFWGRVVNNDPPPPDFKHKSTLDLVKEVFGNVSECRAVDLSPESAALWLKAQDLKQQAKDLDEEIKRLETQVKWEIGDAPVALFPGRSDKMIKRRYVAEQHIQPHTKSAYVVTQTVKYDGRLVAALRQQSKFEAIELLLYGAGYHLTDAEASGSKYYACDGKPPVRVADHDPNSQTVLWLEESNAVDIRVEDSHEAIAEKLKAVL